MRLIWRGGRPFKHQPEIAQNKTKSNGASKETVISLDSSDEESAGKDERYHDNPVFEDEEGEYDPAEPYQPIIQTLDLPLGVEVLHLAFPHLPADRQKTTLASFPTIISEKLVCAVACSDFSVRVFTIPLIPPSPQSKARPKIRSLVSNLDAGTSLYGERMITLMGETSHQSIPKGVSITMTVNSLEEEERAEDVEMDVDEDSGNKLVLSRSASRSRSRSRVGRDHPWDLLVASHSADLSGLLLIHRIALEADGSSMTAQQHGPWRTQYLASPAVSVEFNSALYPAPRHSRLLIAEAKGTVRILDCLPRSRATQGSWLVSLHTHFGSLQGSIPRRTAILDARWVLGGKSILVLLADNKYGIWDIEKARPKAADTANEAPALTAFALEGWTGDSMKSKPLMKSSSAKYEVRSKLAPMTPSTRKTRQEALFTGPTLHPEGPARGGLFVCPIQNTLNSRLDDESILIWQGTTLMRIPSLFTHWQNKVHKAGNLFNSGAKGEPKVISNIKLGGEACTEAALYSVHSGADKKSASPAEILVTGEHRLLIVTSSLTEPSAPNEPTPPPLSSSTDQQLLARGELDVHGMDRILAEMSNGHTPTRSSRNSSFGQRKSLMIT